MKHRPPRGAPPDKGSDEGASSRGFLASIYDTHAVGLYRYAVMILADPAAAEDALHQTFAKLMRLGSTAEQIGSQVNYLRRAVRNECYTILRQRQRDREYLVSQNGLMLEPTSHAGLNQVERLALDRAIRSLPPEQREVVHMKVFEGLTFQQIADLIDVPLNTAASRYRYAVAKLQQALDPQGSGR